MLSNRHAAVTSFTRTCPRKTAICGPQYRATTSATARRGAVQRIVACSAVVEAPGNTQTSGGSPPTPPKQDTTLGGGDGSGDKAPGWWQGWWKTAIEAGPALGTVATGVGILIWHASLATKGDIKELKDSTKGDIKELKDSTKGDIKELKDSLKHVVTWPYLASSVAIYAFGRWGK